MDVIIPAIEQDLKILSKTIQSLRENVVDGVDNIYVVSPLSDSIRKFADENGLIFIDEKVLMGFGKNDFDIGNNWRNGWMYQQLIKLNGDKLAETDNFLVCDADHILLKPHKFYDGEKYYFYTSNEFHIPYFYAISKLFQGKYSKQIKESFISDKMIFNKDVLKNMKNEIEILNNKNWLESIIASYCRESGSGFSEFETYGTYFLSNNDNKKYCLLDDKRFMCKEKKLENMEYNKIKEQYNNINSITLFKLAV